MNYADIFILLFVLVFGYILIQILLFLVIPVEIPNNRVILKKEPDYPPWSYYHLYQTWPYGGLPGFGRNDPLPPSSPYVPGVGRVYKV